MSTHSTPLWLEIRERDGGHASIDVADDIGVDCCVRLSIGEGLSASGPRAEAEAHLNLEQAEVVAEAILAAVRNHRASGSDPTWAPTTVEEERHFPSVAPPAAESEDAA